MHSLDLFHVYKKFQQSDSVITVLENVSVNFMQGETYAIMGRSGSGKSTLIHLLAGIETPDQGEVQFDHASLLSSSQKKKEFWLNKQVGLVFQTAYVIKELSVLENVILPGLIAGNSYQICSRKGNDLLRAVGLEGSADAMPRALSGGQQQRLVLARALFNEPSFLLADEPTGNLDSTTAANILQLLHTVQQRWGMGLIVSTHDKTVAASMKVIWYLNNGSLQIQC